MSLSEMTSTQPKLRTLEGHKYSWETLYSQEAIQKIHNDRPYESVNIDSSLCYIGYAAYVKEFHEAWLYFNDDILLCVTTSEFAGTFASHDDIGVKYYHLTPNPKWKEKKTRGYGEDEYNVVY